MSIPLIPIFDGDSVAYASSGPVKEDEPISFALQNCKRSIEAIVDKFDRGLEIQLYLTGSGNFREQVATIQPYKGNRTQPKPPYLPDVRQYMVEIWRATVVDGKEADDQVAIEYLKDPANRCIVSIDKDLDQIPGNHYNYRKDLFYEVSEAEAAYNFWVQVLAGDRVDNIRGIPGIGPKKAEKLLQQGAHSEYHMYEIAKREYALAYPDNPNALQEHCGLLYIWRKENDKWAPPT